MPRFFFHATVVFWLILIIYWIVTAQRVKKTAENAPYQWLHRLFFVLAGILLFFRHLPYPLGMHLIPQTVPIQSFSLFLCLIGLIGAIWSRSALADNWSGRVTLKEGHQLVQTGPYAIVRNPIYSSILLIFIATVIEHGILCSCIALIFAVIGVLIKMGQEEKLLAEHFPAQFPEYKKRVKKLVPFIW